MVRISEEAYMPEIKGDLISREALKNAIMNDLGLGDEENGSDAEYMAGLQDCYELIDNAPTVEPDRSQGEWIDHTATQNLLWGHLECPFCHKRSNRGASYCQYCGARLKETEKNA